MVVDRNKVWFANEYFKPYLTLLTCFILLKRVEVALLVMNLGKAKALHVSIEKRRKLGTFDMIDSNRKTWHVIDNKSKEDQMDDIGKTPQLKENLKYKTKLT